MIVSDIKAVYVDSFSSVVGDKERFGQTIPQFAEILAAKGLPREMVADIARQRFREITGPSGPYVTSCIKQCLEKSRLLPRNVDMILFSAAERSAQAVDRSFAATAIASLEMTRAVPLLVSWQQCASSLAALGLAWRAVEAGRASNVVVVAFDFFQSATERLAAYALFSDAVSACVVRSGDVGGLQILDYQVGIDAGGLFSGESFAARATLGRKVLGQLVASIPGGLASVDCVFSTNFFEPVSRFNAALWGLDHDTFFIRTAERLGHCGNCDWMLNLQDYLDNGNLEAGRNLLAVSPAPGIFGAVALRS